jgi:hypothetical protein
MEAPAGWPTTRTAVGPMAVTSAAPDDGRTVKAWRVTVAPVASRSRVPAAVAVTDGPASPAVKIRPPALVTSAVLAASSANRIGRAGSLTVTEEAVSSMACPAGSHAPFRTVPAELTNSSGPRPLAGAVPVMRLPSASVNLTRFAPAPWMVLSWKRLPVGRPLLALYVGVSVPLNRKIPYLPLFRITLWLMVLRADPTDRRTPTMLFSTRLPVTVLPALSKMAMPAPLGWFHTRLPEITVLVTPRWIMMPCTCPAMSESPVGPIHGRRPLSWLSLSTIRSRSQRWEQITPWLPL